MQQTTLTSKGQVTIPKNIRDYIGLHAGDKIEFVITEKNEVMLRAITKKVDDMFGALYKPGRSPVSIEDMNAAIAQKIRKDFQ
ncbi:Transcriptional regulator, AbrB family [Crenothrix polyspora]|jgi:AbrB family looped-hinge helix DNA binding protein|uniref:Transcriptional regulator, AbrB family n=1 Tax=Crenothrix polyspora TaxID=360316 RepID=A0A1R4H1J9_9GAMM|nr:AbrB/MazE/SpoVT family DNA-binding domain-containing protein [Crenothrix polyspora]SJM89930.1 Transcriptional regulator, AbrB family [Crenothrix polyspora]